MNIGDRVDTHSHGLGQIVNEERANAGWPDRPNMVLTGTLRRAAGRRRPVPMVHRRHRLLPAARTHPEGVEMTYQRVIPRDLFNEASLLKCYGQLYLQLEFHNFPGVELVHIRNAFDVRQDQRSGAIYIDNIRLSARGVLYGFWRPRNSRAPYPLYLNAGDDDIAVFNDDGTFTAEMLDFLRG